MMLASKSFVADVCCLRISIMSRAPISIAISIRITLVISVLTAPGSISWITTPVPSTSSARDCGEKTFGENHFGIVLRKKSVGTSVKECM